MARFSFVLVCLALAGVCYADQLEANVQFVDDISEFSAEYPDVKLVPLVGEVQPLGQMRYTIGRRVGGDRIVAQGNNNINYPRLQNARINLNYPQNGIGAIVTFVDITVEQTSTDGRAYIVGGGIGQRNINIVIEANRTTRVSYRAMIFGY